MIAREKREKRQKKGERKGKCRPDKGARPQGKREGEKKVKHTDSFFRLAAMSPLEAGGNREKEKKKQGRPTGKKGSWGDVVKRKKEKGGGGEGKLGGLMAETTLYHFCVLRKGEARREKEKGGEATKGTHSAEGKKGKEKRRGASRCSSKCFQTG